LVAITVGGVAVANAVGSNSPHRAGIKTGGAGIVALPTPAAQAVGAAPSPTSSAAPAKPRIQHHAAYHHTKPDSVRIRDVSGNCYVQITTSSGKILVRRIAHRGDLIAFKRHGLDVTLGNAGAVRLVVNGHHAHRAGAAGQVRTFTVR
jgi:hypothetical protein